MPNTVQKSKTRRYIEYLCYIFLLLFFIPLKINNSDEGQIQFQKYITTFNKSYNSSEYNQRLNAFKNSLKNIKLLNLNKTNNSVEYGFTKFSDMFPGEFKDIYLLSNLATLLQHTLPQQNVDYDLNDESRIAKLKESVVKKIPLKIDWREKNMVTEAKSQKYCSACWAFAAIGMIETVYAINSSKLESFSVQNVIDCSPFDGCDGGNVCALLSWMKKSQFKINKERNYPLTLTNGKCKNVTGGGISIKDYLCKDFVGSEEEILYLLALNGPVAVAINALPWQNYIGGVIQFHCDGNPVKLNHAVEIVGYDLTKEVPYYIVKNSWGQDFGDNGYLYIAIGKNMCGLAYEVAAVVL